MNPLNQANEGGRKPSLVCRQVQGKLSSGLHLGDRRGFLSRRYHSSRRAATYRWNAARRGRAHGLMAGLSLLDRVRRPLAGKDGVVRIVIGPLSKSSHGIDVVLD